MYEVYNHYCQFQFLMKGRIMNTVNPNEGITPEQEQDLRIALENALNGLSPADMATRLSALSPREERVVRTILGVECASKTLEEIGAEFSVSATRVYEIATKALGDL